MPETAPILPTLAVDPDALAALIDGAAAILADEKARCIAAYEADAGDGKPQRAETARKHFPAAPWRWYMDPDAATVAAALDRLPAGQAVRAFFAAQEAGQ